ncbi:MAG: hypothetical protein LBG58_16050, partial [Planctomycetaceae bacterium]|nr:hypothetical protein [Planctomycetaceae bacterium]
MNITKSDPRLTSFVLGELSETEAQEIQSAINANPELQTEIEHIRLTVKEIETAMKNEPLPEKLHVIPKRKNRFTRMTAATVALALLIAVIAVFFQTQNQTMKKETLSAKIQAEKIADDRKMPPITEPQLESSDKLTERSRDKRYVRFDEDAERSYIPTDSNTPATPKSSSESL